MARKGFAALAAVVMLGAPGGIRAQVSSDTQQADDPALGVTPSFEVNRGQADPRVRYLARGPGYSTLLADAGPTFLLDGAAVRLELVGGHGFASPSASDPLPGTVNYFLGRDPSDWHTGIPTYARVGYEDVYSGIDLDFRGTGSAVEYDFVIEPGADPGMIGMRFEGAEGLRLEANGNLVIGSTAGDLVHRAPVVYQVVDGERVEVEGGYVLDGGRVGFHLGRHDRDLPLVIDPVVMVYSTFLGGGDHDEPFDISVDAGGRRTSPGAHTTR